VLRGVLVTSDFPFGATRVRLLLEPKNVEILIPQISVPHMACKAPISCHPMTCKNMHSYSNNTTAYTDGALTSIFASDLTKHMDTSSFTTSDTDSSTILCV
jgi:hypothetical protein